MKRRRLKNLFIKTDHKIENISSKHEFIIVTITAILLVLSVVCIMGTITSGFHLVDDHEYARWTYQLRFRGESLWDLLYQWIKNDFAMRYEPIYYSMRILGANFFGINLTAYSIIKAVQIIISLIFLYYCGRLMGAKKIYALLFSAISLIGYQSAVWWKLGPQETQCTMLFSIGFFCLLKWLQSKKRKWGISSIILFFIMCNYKESFILLIPFIVCYVIYDSIERHSDKAKQSKDKGLPAQIKETCEGLKGKYWYLITMTLIFIVLIVIILLFVGVNNYGGAGLNADAGWDIYKEAFFKSMNTDLKWFKRFGIIFMAILLTFWEDLKKLWKEVFLTIVFLAPQFIIFAQTGIAERYILPSAIGFALFFVIIISKWKPLAGRRRFVYCAGLLLLLLAHSRAMLIEADYFKYRGEGITNMLETVRELSDEDTRTLSCLNDEGNLTLKYWSYQNGLDEDNIFYWNEADQSIQKGVYENDMNGTDSYYQTELSIEDIDMIVMYTKRDRHFTHFPSIDSDRFTKLDSGTLEIWIRKL